MRVRRASIRALPLIGIGLALAACDGQSDTVMVGQLASDRVELRALFTEAVISRPFAEGASVREGDIIIEQDTSRFDARYREIEAMAAAQQARIDELTRGPRREQIAAARARLEGAEQDAGFRRLEYRRAVDVLEKGLAAPDSVDRAKAALDTAEAARDAQAALLDELLAGTTVEELRQAEQQLEALRAQLAQVAVDRQRLASRAPAAGRLDTLLIEPGERPLPGETLAVLLTGTQPYARIYVPESLRAGMTPGQRVTVRIDGLVDPVDGTVRWVSADAAFTPFFALTEHDRGRLTYAAKIDLDIDSETRSERLPDGVPVEATLAGDSGSR